MDQKRGIKRFFSKTISLISLKGVKNALESALNRALVFHIAQKHMP